MSGCASNGEVAAGSGCSGGGRAGFDCRIASSAEPAEAPQATPEAPKRADVTANIATTSPDVFDSAAREAPAFKPPEPKVANLTLENAIAAAVLGHPLMGAAAARIQKAKSGIGFAQAALEPTLSVDTGTGWAGLGQYSNYPTIAASGGVPGTERTDFNIAFRKLIFDFGAAREEVERNKSLADSEKLKLADQAEEIALRTVNAYLNQLEQQEQLALIDDTIASQRKLAKLVQLSQENGNSAAADVDRINSKIIEIEAMRADIDSANRVAREELRRLTGIDSRSVTRPKVVSGALPATPDAAVEESRRNSPAVLAIRAQAVALDHQLASQKASQLPRVDFEGDGGVKHYVGVPSASIGVIDSRAMVVVSYKMFDGGAGNASVEHILADQNENRFNELDQMETLELNLRRFYEQIAADGAKHASYVRGVQTAEKVNSLYTEQFKAGKRTVFEVLDSFTSIFSMRKALIEGQYDAMRARYGILRNLGRLNASLVGKGG